MSKSVTGEKSVIAFQAWQASMSEDDFRQIVFRGSLNRDQVAKACGIAKSALRQNPVVRQLLDNLEIELREKKILPERVETIKESILPKVYDQGANRLLKADKRLVELEQELIELKSRMRRYQELEEVLLELGIDI